MTKTFTEKGIEYLLVEVPEDCTLDCYANEYESISLLKDITEEQAKEIVEEVAVLYLPTYTEALKTLLIFNGIDTSLNWLLLKKI